MEITKIGAASVSGYKPKSLTKGDIAAINEKKIENSKSPTIADTNWQKNILLDALDKLENSIQMTNNHPLDYAMNAPIDTFDEALIELSFTKTELFRKQASGAQANIKAEDVLSLFAEEYA